MTACPNTVERRGNQNGSYDALARGSRREPCARPVEDGHQFCARCESTLAKRTARAVAGLAARKAQAQ